MVIIFTIPVHLITQKIRNIACLSTPSKNWRFELSNLKNVEDKIREESIEKEKIMGKVNKTIGNSPEAATRFLTCLWFC